MVKTRAGAFLTARSFERIPWLVHGFGTRRWSASAFLKRGENRKFRLVAARQVHSDTILCPDRKPRTPLRGDALTTRRPHLLLAVRTADCLPLLVVDPRRRVVAAVHCGWRGTAARLAEKTVLALRRRFGCRPDDLRAALGPCVGPRCYEVGEDVRDAFRRASLPLRDFVPLASRREKFHLDLAAANVRQLVEAGLGRARIERLEACTHCLMDFCSYRRDPDAPGRQTSFIGMRSSSGG